MRALSVALAATLVICANANLLFGGSSVEDFLATQASRFATDNYIRAYTQMSPATRRCLIRRGIVLFESFWKSQPINMPQQLDLARANCPQGFDRAQNFINIVFNDYKRLTPRVQYTLSTFANELALNGRRGAQTSFINFQSNWLKAQPIDWQTMGVVFPQMKFFFNGPYVVPLAQQALSVAQCNRAQIPELIRTALAVYQLASKTNPTPPQGPYAALHRAVHEDFAALRTYAAASSTAGPLLGKEWSLEAAWQIYDGYCPRSAKRVSPLGQRQRFTGRH